MQMKATREKRSPKTMNYKNSSNCPWFENCRRKTSVF